MSSALAWQREGRAGKGAGSDVACIIAFHLYWPAYFADWMRNLLSPEAPLAVACDGFDWRCCRCRCLATFYNWNVNTADISPPPPLSFLLTWHSSAASSSKSSRAAPNSFCLSCATTSVKNVHFAVVVRSERVFFRIFSILLIFPLPYPTLPYSFPIIIHASLPAFVALCASFHLTLLFAQQLTLNTFVSTK